MSDTAIGSRAWRVRGAASLWTATGIGAWLRRRRAYRARLAHAQWDLRERYGGAAYAIARSSARQAVGRESRRFWSKVAAGLRRRTGA